MHRYLPVLLFGLACASPLPPEVAAEADRLYGLVLDRMLEGQARVLRVADPMRIAGAELCGAKIAPVLGVYATDRRTFDEALSDRSYVAPFVAAAIEQLRLVEQPRILVVTAGLAGDLAGLRPGDLVVAVDGEPVERRLSLDRLARGEPGVPIRFEVERDGERVVLDVDAPLGCAIPSRFIYGPQINAFATSFGNLTGVYFHSGLLRFFDEDEDLALIVGHELAHIVLGHTAQYRTLANSEADSDYLGLYFAARAGYPVTGAPQVWHDFAIVNPYGLMRRGFYGHPTSGARALQQRAALEEIEGKRARGESLVPERGLLTMARPEVEEQELSVYQESLRKEAAAELGADAARILEVSHRLARAGADVCGEAVGPVLGAVIGRAYDLFPWGQEEDAAEAFGVGKRVTVVAVDPGSPAARAGLAARDVVLSVDGRRVRRTHHVFERMRASRSGDISLRIERNGTERKLVVPREVGCAYGALVYPSSSIDTGHHQNRNELEIPTGLLRFARDEDEVAVAISHQLGHHLLGSMRKPANEMKADDLGLRIAHAAGYDIEKAPAYWDHYSAEQFWKVSSRRVSYHYVAHAAIEFRAPLLRAAVKRIVGSPANGPGPGTREAQPVEGAPSPS